MAKTPQYQLRAVAKYKKKHRKQLNFEFFEKDYDLLDMFQSVRGETKNKKFRLLLKTYFNVNKGE